MKRMLSLLLIFLMLSSQLTVSGAEAEGILLAEVFEDYVTHSVPESGTFSSQEVYVGADGAHNKQLIFRSTEEGFITMQYDGLKLPNTFGFTVEISVSGAKVSGDISLFNDSGKSINVYNIDGNNGMTNPSGYRIGGLSNIKKQLTFLYNADKAIYSIYIDGKRVNKNTYLKPDAVIKDITTLKMSLVSLGGVTEITIDNLYFYTGDTYRAVDTLPKKTYNTDSIEYESKELVSKETVYFFRSYDEPAMDPFYGTRARVTDGSMIDVMQEKDGNKYLRMSCGPTSTRLDINNLGDDSNYSGVADIEKRFVIFQLDVFSPQFPKSGILINLRDVEKDAVSLVHTSGNSLIAGSTKLGTLPVNKWINIAAVADFAERTYDVYVDYELVATDIAITNSAFSMPHVWYIIGNTGVMHIDNIASYSGTMPYAMTYDSYEPVSRIKADRADLSVLKTMEVLNTNSKRLYVGGERVDEGDDLFIGEEEETLVNVEKIAAAYGADFSAGDGKAVINGVILKNITEENGKIYAPYENVFGAFGKKTYFDGRGMILAYKGELDTQKYGVFGDYGLWDIFDYTNYDRPTGEQITAIYNELGKGRHPRIIYTPEQIEELKKQVSISEGKKRQYDIIIKQADGVIGSPPTEYDEVDNVVEARSMLNRATYLGQAYLFTGDEKYAEQVWKDLKFMIDTWRDWQPLTNLAHAETLTTFAIAYDWCYDYFTEEQRDLIEKLFLERCIEVGFDIHHGRTSTGARHWMNTPHNQNPVGNGGHIMAAICLMDKYPEEASEHIARSLKSFEAYGRAFYPGGAYAEGIGYWLYGTLYWIRLISSLDAAFGTDFGMSNMPDFDKSPYYIIDASSMHTRNNYHACGEAPPSESMGPFAYLSHKFDDPNLELIRKLYFDRAGLPSNDFFYSDPDADASQVDRALDSYYKRIEIVNMRADWADEDGAFVSYHGGDALPGHGHVDSGTFVLDMLGERFVSDMGGEDYYYAWEIEEIPEIAEKIRLAGVNEADPWLYRIRPEAHNCFVINPDFDSGHYLHAFSPVVRFETKARGAISVMDLSECYKDNAKSAYRGVMMGDDRRSVTVRDEIVVKEENSDVYWFMYTKADVEIVDASSAILTLNGKQVLMKFVTNGSDVTFEKGEAKPLETSPQYMKKSTDEFTKVWIKAKTNDEIYVEVKYIPLSDPKANEELIGTPIAEWTIPDGEVEPLPSIDMIYLNGEEIENYLPTKRAINKKLAEGQDVPVVSVSCNDKYEYEIKQAAGTEDITEIKVWLSSDPSIYSIYTVAYTVLPKLSDYMGYERLQVYGVEGDIVPQPENGPYNLIDDNLSTTFAMDNPSGTWARLDLGSEQKIDAIALGVYKGDTRVNKFHIEVSNDRNEWTRVYSGETSGKTLEMEIFTMPEPVYGRYIRYVAESTSNGTWYTMTEFYALRKN